MNVIYLDKPSYLPPSAISKLERLGNFKVYNDMPAKEEAVSRLSQADVAIVEWTAIDSEMFERISRLKCIVLVTTGYDFIDIEAAKKRGIQVCNTPQYSQQSVAEHVFALAFALGKRLCDANALAREKPGKAAYTDHSIGLELFKKTLGIWGLGSIGSWVAKIGNGFGMRVIGCSRTTKNLPNVEELHLEDVLSQADLLAICITINPSTKGFLTYDRLRTMKKGAILINIVENGVLDEEAVAKLLDDNHLLGAAFDSTPSQDSPLLKAKNTFFTPGTAWYTQSSLDRNAEMFVDTVQAFINGKPRYVVNP